jgi:hypothetical protein
MNVISSDSIKLTAIIVSEANSDIKAPNETPLPKNSALKIRYRPALRSG